MEKKNRTLLTCIFVAALLGGVVWPVSAQEAPSQPVPSPSFDQFKLILERNIFNPNRRKISEIVAERPAPPPQVQQLSLLGTLLSDVGSYAFFEAVNTDLKSVYQLGDILADYTITDILTSKIILKTNDRQIELPVGMGLSRKEDEPWKVTTIEPAFRKESSPSKSNQLVSKTMAKEERKPGESESDTNDILKKLMERRKQELEQ